MKQTELLKRNKLTALLFLFLTSLFITACKDDSLETIKPNGGRVSVYNCNNFTYSDTIFFKSNQTTPYVINPSNTMPAGVFGAYPDGLSINTSTGAINVNLSEGGLKYKVFYVKNSSVDTCFKFVSISGVDYLSKIYNLDNNDSLAFAKYKGLSSLLPCSDDDDDDDDDDEDDDDDDDEDDDDGCEFDDDEDDDDGDGTGDEPASGQDLASQGVDINKTNGTINLKKSLQNGTLGSNPANGAFKDMKLFYRLNDNSQKALNAIDLRVYYFKKVSDIPLALLTTLNDKTNSIYNVQKGSNNGARIGVKKPRPPYIIVVGRFDEY